VKINNPSPQPFLFIVLFSILLLFVLLFMQYKSNKSIYGLQKSNEQAMQIFQANIKMQEIINYNYEVENLLLQFLASKKSDTALYIPKAIASINNGITDLKKLASTPGSQPLVNRLSGYIDRQAVFYTEVFNLSYRDNEAAKSLLVSNDAKQRSDNIYEVATLIQLELEKDLKRSIEENTGVSKKVQLLGQWLIFLAVGAVLVLGTIIVRHLYKNVRLIQDLEIARNKTHRAALVKEQFLANMSHEIRTPINSVIGFTHLLQKTHLSAEQQQFVNLIKTSGNNLLNIVNDILDISKLEANMLQLEKKPFSIKELLYTLEMMFAHKAAEKGLRYAIQVADNVPVLVLGDKDRLNQVLTNLIANAIKFTDAGEVNVTVEQVTTYQHTATLRFIVKDTGIGIDASKQESIFERFEQADTDSNRKYGGTGLGLSIAKHIIKMHGGFIKVKSHPGNGAEFLFEITYPLEPGTVPARLLPVAEDLFQDHSLLAGKRILAAEDNKMNQTLLQFLFKQWEVDFSIAETGEEAIASLKQGEYDLVLLDIQMPVMDGYHTAWAIRNEMQSGIPIIAMTAHVLPGEREKCIAAGMNDYISKPISETELLKLVKQYLPSSKDGYLHQYVSTAYLRSTYSHNHPFIKEVLLQFKEQYPAELSALQQAVETEDVAQIKKWGHHLKTTVTAIHNNSPLFEYCQGLEQIKAGTVDSQEQALALLNELLHSKPIVLREIDSLLEKAQAGLAVK
jgi:signal transduction histidine kinase/DNA-binding response OmpR family regulator